MTLKYFSVAVNVMPRTIALGSVPLSAGGLAWLFLGLVIFAFVALGALLVARYGWSVIPGIGGAAARESASA